MQAKADCVQQFQAALFSELDELAAVKRRRIEAVSSDYRLQRERLFPADRMQGIAQLAQQQAANWLYRRPESVSCDERREAKLQAWHDAGVDVPQVLQLDLEYKEQLLALQSLDFACQKITAALREN